MGSTYAGVPIIAWVLTVGVFALVQSLFGVGLLVFGTPTLLLLIVAVPAVLVATAVALMSGSPHQTRAVVGVMLLLTAVIRLGRFHSLLAGFIGRHLAPFMLALGVLHGLSNLGGGVLTVIVGSRYTDKESIRRHIAFAYGAMACVQLTVVFVTKRPQVNWGLWVLLPLLAGSIYLLVGQRVFRRARQGVYQFCLT